MIREMKRLIGIIATVAVLAIIIIIFTIFWPAFVTTSTVHTYTHAATDPVSITVLCGTLRDCSVFVNNSTGNRINVTIVTTSPLNAEYKGAQKVREAFSQNVTFMDSGTSLGLEIRLAGGDEMFQLSPSKASVNIYLPAGTNYTLVKKWPYTANSSQAS